MLSLHVPAAYTFRYPCNLWTSICLAISSHRSCLMRFVFLGAEVCVRLPSDSASQRTPLPLANGWRLQTPIVELHHQACCHARHTTKKNDKDVIQFLNSIENEQRKKDCFTLLELMQEVTKEPPAMWGDSIVGFGSYHYKYDSGREGDWFPTGFSPRKQNLTIYISAGFEPFRDILQDLGKHKTSSSCLYIKKLDQINLDQLKLLIRKSAEYIGNKYGQK